MLAVLDMLVAISRVLLAFVQVVVSSELVLLASMVLLTLLVAMAESVLLVVLICAAPSEPYVLVAVVIEVATGCSVVLTAVGKRVVVSVALIVISALLTEALADVALDETLCVVVVVGFEVVDP